MSEWRDKSVLVTGGASGIGAAVTRLLLAEGARVEAWDRDAAGLARLAPEVGAALRACEVDVTDERAVEHALAELEQRDPLSGLVNAAGTLVEGKLCDPALSLAALERAFMINAASVWLVSRAAARGMARRGSGSIVTVSSNAASTPRMGMGAYCASKAAASMLTRCLGLELASSGVRCNVVSPGSTDTPMLREMLRGEAPERLIQGNMSQFRLGIPLGRIARPSDVAEAVVFLLSERARHITLHDLRVDAGATF